MLARVAEALFLVARELEQVETTSRLLEATHAGELEGGAESARDWWTLVRVTGEADAFMASYPVAEAGTVGWHLTLSDENPDSVAGLVRRARDRANSVRDRLSSDVWEALNGLHHEIAGWSGARLQRDGIYAFSREMRQRVYLTLGLIDTTLRRDDHWTFLRLGRFLERAMQTARLVLVHAESISPDHPLETASLDLHRLGSLLHSASADELYARMHPAVAPQWVMQFLIFDDRFPRSVAFSLRVVEESQLSLVDDLAMVPHARSLGLTGETREFLQSTKAFAPPNGPKEFLGEVERRCVEIGEAVHATCFAPQYVRPGRAWDAQAQGQSQN